MLHMLQIMLFKQNCIILLVLVAFQYYFGLAYDLYFWSIIIKIYNIVTVGTFPIAEINCYTFILKSAKIILKINLLPLFLAPFLNKFINYFWCSFDFAISSIKQLKVLFRISSPVLVLFIQTINVDFQILPDSVKEQ